jgi:hypothetical protein
MKFKVFLNNFLHLNLNFNAEMFEKGVRSGVFCSVLLSGEEFSAEQFSPAWCSWRQL